MFISKSSLQEQEKKRFVAWNEANYDKLLVACDFCKYFFYTLLFKEVLGWNTVEVLDDIKCRHLYKNICTF